MPDDQQLQTTARVNLPAIPAELATPDQIADYLLRLETEINNALVQLERNLNQKLDIDGDGYIEPHASLVVAYASISTITITGADVTESFPADRRLRLTRSDTDVQQLGYVSSSGSSFASNVTTVNITLLTGNIDTATDRVEIATSLEQTNVSYRDLTTEAAALAIDDSVGTAAFADTGTDIGDVAVHTSGAALGTAAYKDHGTSIGDVPLHIIGAELGEGAYEDVGNVTGELPLNTEDAALGELAYDDVPANSFTEKSTNSTSWMTFSATVPVVVPALGNIAVPGSPDGAKKYFVSFTLTLSYNDNNALGIGTNQVRVYLGQNGDTTDTLVAAVAIMLTLNNRVTANLTQFEITPDSGDKITIAVIAPANSTAAASKYTAFGSTSTVYSACVLQEQLGQ